MEYVWIVMLMVAYFSIWAAVADKLYKVYWRKINFVKVWVYLHRVLIVLGLIGLFAFSLGKFIGVRK